MKTSKRTSAPAAQPPATRLTYAEAIDRGAILLGTGKLADAEQICRTILQAKPDDFNAVLLLGIVRSHRNELVDALACFEQALSSQPGRLTMRSSTAPSRCKGCQRQAKLSGRNYEAVGVKPDIIESHSTIAATRCRLSGAPSRRSPATIERSLLLRSMPMR